MIKKRKIKRKKKSGIVYFAVNNRIENMVKIGMTIDTAESRLEKANSKNEFTCGIWSITQKVKTNDAKRTESLAHTLFGDQLDNESISTEMYFIPADMTVKDMADEVREKDQIHVKQMEKEEIAKKRVLDAQKIFDELQLKHEKDLLRDLPKSESTELEE
jgi:hypothetical protein